MTTQSLIPSFEDTKLHSADKVASDVLDTLQSEIKAFETMANPDICDEKYLPFLAYTFGVDFWDENLSAENKRALIKQSLALHKHKGTIWAIEQVLFALDVKAVISEWFKYGGEPYYFKIKIDIQQQFPNINQLANLVDKYKNVRSKYEIDFDVETNTHYKEIASSATSVDFFQGLSIEKQTKLNVSANNNFGSDFVAILMFDKTSEHVMTSSSTFDIYTSRDYFDIDRFIDVKNQAIANMRLDFSYNESDVMHLPIPPIELKTVVSDMAVAVFDMDFSQNSSDVFHLNYEKHYEALGGVYIDNYGVIDMEFYDGGVDFNTTTQTLTANAVQSVNLDI